MKKMAFIPARLGSIRFPGKLLADLAGKPVLIRTCESTMQTGLFDDVVVVCDGPEIESVVREYGYTVIRSRKEHESGSDRIAEAVENLDVDVILNVQGDEPFTRREPLSDLLDVFEGAEGAAVQVASLMRVFSDEASRLDPNNVKVVVDLNFNSLLFSRAPIPYVRDHTKKLSVYKHIGVYAFRKKALMDFTNWPVSPLEALEKIECLRYLEHGIQLKMVLTDFTGVGVDTPEDLILANKYYQELQDGLK